MEAQSLEAGSWGRTPPRLLSWKGEGGGTGPGTVQRRPNAAALDRRRVQCRRCWRGRGGTTSHSIPADRKEKDRLASRLMGFGGHSGGGVGSKRAGSEAATRRVAIQSATSLLPSQTLLHGVCPPSPPSAQRRAGSTVSEPGSSSINNTCGGGTSCPGGAVLMR